MSNNVLVIGNGFDLAHNLRTSYNHFMEYVRKVKSESEVTVGTDDIFFKECIENNGFLNYFLDYTNEVPGWVDLEQLIREVVGYFELFFSNYTHIIDNRSCITWDSTKGDMTQSGKLKIINCLYMFPLYDKDNMVLGFNDDAPENLDFVYFKKYFQRIQKLTGYIDNDKLWYNDRGRVKYPVIHFYGHSMDKTDGDVIQKLRASSSGFVIYTYSQEDYEQKVINLIDVFGKEQAMEMIQNGFMKFVPCEQKKR